jgi:DNA-binding response OmpR family regulator
MKKVKLLYIEDEPFLGRIVKETLETQGYEVLMLTDGRSVLKKWVDFKPDLGIFDVMLPYKNGYEIAKEIRESYPKTPIVFLTAKTEVSDVIKGFKVGGNDYLKKPFSVEELIMRIENLLQLTKNTINIASKELKIGNYIINTQHQELKKGNNIRKLSFREIELLKIFAEHPNQIISRQKILIQIWNDNSFYNSRNLDVYVTRLRQFLKGDSRIEILTLRGVGYKILISDK